MTWVIKLTKGPHAGSYVTTPGTYWGTIREARRFTVKQEIYFNLSKWTPRTAAFEPRIVRLRPRAKLDEAAIRRAERERIAAALKPWRITEGLLLGDRVMISTTNTGDHTRQAREVLLAFDWKPEQK